MNANVHDLIALARSVPLWVWVQAATVIFLSVVGAVVALRIADLRRPPDAENPSAPGARVFYLSALVFAGVSLNTSWRFFAEHLGITNPIERLGLFAGLEIFYLGAGMAMRARARTKDGPRSGGRAQIAAWALTAASAYMALAVGGWPDGLIRVILGPVAGLVALHLALVEEKRARKGGTGAWTQVVATIRERMLSWLGWANLGATAEELTRARALRRAAYLGNQENRWYRPFLKRRRLKALHAALVGVNPEANDQLLSMLGVLKHADALPTLTLPSPWMVKQHQDQAAEPAELAAVRAELEQTRAQLESRPAVDNEVVAELRQKLDEQAACLASLRTTASTLLRTLARRKSAQAGQFRRVVAELEQRMEAQQAELEQLRERPQPQAVVPTLERSERTPEEWEAMRKCAHEWAREYVRTNGQIPTGREVAAVVGASERWGLKQVRSLFDELHELAEQFGSEVRVSA